MCNKEMITKVISKVWGAPETAEYMDPDFSIEFRNAPPGMPQYFDSFDVVVLNEWLANTVKTWDVNIEELYAGTENDLYFAVGTLSAQVCWGFKDSQFDSKFLYMIQLKDGKFFKVKMMMDTLAFLVAAGREVPPFVMDTKDANVIKYAQENPAQPIPDEDVDCSFEEISKRIKVSLDSFKGIGEAIYSPEFEGGPVFFLPYTMRNIDPADMPNVEAWTMLSCPPPWVSNEKAVIHATEDPFTFFGECGLICRNSQWVGNNVNANYYNRYFYIIRFDKKGRMKAMEEFLNPVNKYNSINVSLPTFPFYMYH